MEVLGSVLTFKDVLEPLITTFVGLFAFAVYLLQKSSERQNAAVIIVMDIRHAEQVVTSMMDRGIDIWNGDVLRENNWSKYKHLFARKFSSDDYAAFSRFFEACLEMSDARRRMRDMFYAAIDEKARIAQRKLHEQDLPEGFSEAQFIGRLNSHEFVFDANEPKQRIARNLAAMGRLSNTAGYAKLKRIAGERY